MNMSQWKSVKQMKGHVRVCPPYFQLFVLSSTNCSFADEQNMICT